MRAALASVAAPPGHETGLLDVRGRRCVCVRSLLNQLGPDPAASWPGTRHRRARFGAAAHAGAYRRASRRRTPPEPCPTRLLRGCRPVACRSAHKRSHSRSGDAPRPPEHRAPARARRPCLTTLLLTHVTRLGPSRYISRPSLWICRAFGPIND